MGSSWPTELLASLFTEPRLASLPLPVRWTAAGLLHLATSSGPHPLHEGMLRAAIWPLDETVTADDLVMHILRLEDAGFCSVETDSRGSLVYRLHTTPEAARGTDPPRNGTSSTPNATPSAPPGTPRNIPETHSEGEAAEEAGGGVPPRPPRLPPEVYRAELGPVPWCPEHPGNSTAECGPCGGQREHARRWRAERALERRYERKSPDG